MEPKPGDIFWVTIDPSRAVGSEQHGRRPFVVVSRLSINRALPIVVGVPLTSRRTTESQPPFRILIPAREISKDVQFAGTITDSVALTEQVRVLSAQCLENKMGTLSQTALVAVGLGLAYVFDI